MSVVRDLTMMTKPRIAVMVLLTTFVGFLAVKQEPFDKVALACVLLGVLFVAGASSVLNQWIERHFDAQMPRTKDRPIPTGRVQKATALWFALILTLVGTAVLIYGTNLLTTLLSLSTLLMYVFIYTPLKRMTAANTIIGAIPGAMPPVLGWTAAANSISAESGALFAILFLWQLPHFLSIAWLYRDDYAQGGFNMLSLHDDSGQLTARQMIVHCVGLIFVSLLPFHFDMGGWIYLAGAQLIGVLFLASTVLFWMRRTRRNAKFVLRASLIYLPVIFMPLALGL